MENRGASAKLLGPLQHPRATGSSVPVAHLPRDAHWSQNKLIWVGSESCTGYSKVDTSQSIREVWANIASPHYKDSHRGRSRDAERGRFAQGHTQFWEPKLLQKLLYKSSVCYLKPGAFPHPQVERHLRGPAWWHGMNPGLRIRKWVQISLHPSSGCVIGAELLKPSDVQAPCW